MVASSVLVMDEVGAPVEHPLVAGVTAVRASLAQALGCPPTGLSDAATLDLLGEVLALAGMVTALTGAVVTDVVGRELAAQRDYPSTEALLTARFRLTRAQANAAVRDARALAGQPMAADLLATGQANPVQALSIVQTLERIDHLPLVSADERVWAEAFLREQATLLDAVQLARAGSDLVEKLTRTPDIDDPAEVARLERDADRAYRPPRWRLPAASRRIRASLVPPGRPVHGRRRGRARAAGQAPARGRRGQGPPQPCPASRRRARRAGRPRPRPGDFADSGGERPHVAVSIDYFRLTQSLSGLLIDTGAVLAPSEARRIACDAGIFPMVLSGSSLAIDIGRASRHWPAGTRRAIVERDRGCVFPGCDRPPSLARVHHRWHWAAGGPTTVDNGALLCEHHHRVVHRHGWTVILDTHGLPALVPPVTIDPAQRTRQHHRFRLRELGPPG